MNASKTRTTITITTRTTTITTRTVMLLGSGGIGFGRARWCIHTSGFVLIWFPLSGVLADPARIEEEFRKAWLPYFCRSGQREASLDEFDRDEVSLPRLTGQVLADVVQREGATAGSLDGWGWRELKVLLVSWYDELARTLSEVEDTGVWPDGLLDAYIAMIPKTDVMLPPLVKGLLVFFLLCIVFGLLLVWVSLKIGFSLGFLLLFIVLVEVVVLLTPGFLLPWILRRFCLVLLILMSTFLLLMLSNLLIQLIGAFWIGF